MNLKNLVLGIGIFVMYALVLWQGVEAFYPQPVWEDFCEGSEFARFPGNFEKCTISSEVRNKQIACEEVKGHFVEELDESGCVIDGVCDECRIEYNDALDRHSRNIFFISLVLAVITFIVGFSILKVEPVGSALLASGVWAVFFGTVVNWRNFGNISRFVLLLITLAVLIWIALRLNTKRKK